MTFAELHQGMGPAIFLAITATLSATYLDVELCRADRKIVQLLKREREAETQEYLVDRTQTPTGSKTTVIVQAAAGADHSQPMYYLIVSTTNSTNA